MRLKGKLCLALGLAMMWMAAAGAESHLGCTTVDDAQGVVAAAGAGMASVTGYAYAGRRTDHGIENLFDDDPATAWAIDPNQDRQGFFVTWTLSDALREQGGAEVAGLSVRFAAEGGVGRVSQLEIRASAGDEEIYCTAEFNGASDMQLVLFDSTLKVYDSVDMWIEVTGWRDSGLVGLADIEPLLAADDAAPEAEAEEATEADAEEAQIIMSYGNSQKALEASDSAADWLAAPNGEALDPQPDPAQVQPIGRETIEGVEWVLVEYPGDAGPCRAWTKADGADLPSGVPEVNYLRKWVFAAGAGDLYAAPDFGAPVVGQVSAGDAVLLLDFEGSRAYIECEGPSGTVRGYVADWIVDGN